MKKLISIKDIENAKNIVYIDKNTLVTPAARDLAIEKQIKIIVENEKERTNENNIEMKDLMEALKKLILNGDYKKILECLREKYKSFLDPTGVEIVDGESIEYENKDTKYSEIYFQTIKSKKTNLTSGKIKIRGFYEMDLEKDRSLYIIDGKLTLVIEGRECICKKGDIVFLPKENKISLKGEGVIFCTENS